MSTLLQGDILPARSLEPLAGGAPVRIGPNRKRAQVLVVTHPDPCADCASYVGSFEAMADEYKAEKADVIAVVGPAWAGGSSVTARAVVDNGSVGATLSPGRTPVVAVADQYGQLYAVRDAGDDHVFPGHEAILATLLNIAIACPECGVPDVPSGMSLPEMGTSSGGMRLGS